MKYQVRLQRMGTHTIAPNGFSDNGAMDWRTVSTRIDMKDLHNELDPVACPATLEYEWITARTHFIAYPHLAMRLMRTLFRARPNSQCSCCTGYQ
jgi:hypothetical protein